MASGTYIQIFHTYLAALQVISTALHIDYGNFINPDFAINKKFGSYNYVPIPKFDRALTFWLYPDPEGLGDSQWS